MATFQKRTACNRDCPDACGLIATITDGRVTRLQGDPDHPVTQGFLCKRTSRFLDRQYSPDRLLKPLLRDGEHFKPVDWNRALDLVAEKMLRFRDESGGASIINYRCGGSMGIMKAVIDYFFEEFGPVTTKSGDICSGAGEAAQEIDFGVCESHDLFDVSNSKTIFLWGKNVFVSSVHLIPILQAARKRGAKLVLIDPVHHRTASICDQFVQPKPGTDYAIAMGIVRWLSENEKWDPAADQYCDHLHQFRSLVMSRTIAEYARIAEIDETELIGLAEAYARGPTSIQVGWGMQRRRFGASAIRTIDALATVSGNIGIAGGGVSFCYARRGAFDFSFADPNSAPRRIPEPLLGEGILNATDPPIRMAVVSSANPVAMLPDSHAVAKALQTREFTVVIDSFMTDTARCADLVLPATTMLEEDDLLGAYGHHYLTEMKPVVESPDGVRSDLDIIRQLARRVGLQHEFSGDARSWKQRLLGKLTSHGIDLNSFQQQPAIRNPLVETVMFTDRNFPTETGRVNLIHELPSEMTQQVDQLQSKRPSTPQKLTLAALSTDKAQASQWPAGSQSDLAHAIVHPLAASKFNDGDAALLRSAVGEMNVQLKFDSHQRCDIVLLEKGGWLESGRCANALIKGQITDHGQCAVYYDTEVEILPINS